MIELIDIRKLAGEQQTIARAIYEEAFPPQEKRPWELHERLVATHSAYSFQVALAAGEIIGIVVAWQLADHLYLDYLATNTASRNKGYGRTIMTALLETCKDMPVVLEVEIPDNELAVRRVGFYERLGFHLIDFPYFMPDFTNPEACFPMRLMTYPEPLSQSEAPALMEEIHREVYQKA